MQIGPDPYNVDVSAVEISDLVVRYGNVTAVHGISLTAEAGSITALIGSNGAGKTSVIEVCVGLRSRQRGLVSILGTDPAHSTADSRANVGIMLQDGGLYPSTKARPWLTMLGKLTTEPRNINELMDQLGISADWPTVRRMSGGQIQRLKLASALIGRPRVLFLDEPTASLDVQARAGLHSLIRDLRESGTCIVLTTHDLSDVEALADDVYVMDAGRIVANGTLAELTQATDGLRFLAAPRLPIEALQAVLPQLNSVEEKSPGSYVVTGPTSPELLATITHWCAEQGVLPSSMNLGAQGLADIMNGLVGKGEMS